MKFKTTHLLSLGFVALSFGLAAWLYPALPEQVPVQWNIHGEAHTFWPKPWGAFFLPFACLGAYVVFRLLPRISPKGFGFQRFARTYEVLQISLMAFFFLVSAMQLFAASGRGVPMRYFLPVAVGLLFVVLGNFMGKLTKNFFIGIRTPWTLASDEVWLRTHRLGGKLFVLSGMLLAAAGFLGGGIIALLLATAIATVVPALYSYMLYRRLEGPQGTDSGFDS